AVEDPPAAAAGHEADAGLEHPRHEAVVERLVEVAHRPELLLDPALLDFRLVSREALGGDAPGLERFEDRLGGEHAGLHAEVDALEPLAVQHAGRIADEEEAVAREARHRPPAALRQRLGAVEAHLSACEKLFDLRMG